MIAKIQQTTTRHWFAALLITATLATSALAISNADQSMATNFDSSALIAGNPVQDNGGG